MIYNRHPEKQEKDSSILVPRRGKGQMIGSLLKWKRHLASKEVPIARPKAPLSDVPAPAERLAGMLAPAEKLLLQFPVTTDD